MCGSSLVVTHSAWHAFSHAVSQDLSGVCVAGRRGLHLFAPGGQERPLRCGSVSAFEWTDGCQLSGKATPVTHQTRFSFVAVPPPAPTPRGPGRPGLTRWPSVGSHLWLPLHCCLSGSFSWAVRLDRSHPLAASVQMLPPEWPPCTFGGTLSCLPSYHASLSNIPRLSLCVCLSSACLCPLSGPFCVACSAWHQGGLCVSAE